MVETALVKLTRRGRVLIDGRNPGGPEFSDKITWTQEGGFYVAYNNETGECLGRSRNKDGLCEQIEGNRNKL